MGRSSQPFFHKFSAFIFSALLVSVFFIASQPAYSQSLVRTPAQFIRSEHRDGDYVPGQLLVKFKNRVDIKKSELLRTRIALDIAALDLLNSSFGLRDIISAQSSNIHSGSLNHAYLLIFEDKYDMEDLADRYEADPAVEYAQPNYYNFAFFTPNDEYYNLQWNFNNSSSNRSDINLPEAWDYDTTSPTSGGSPDIVVAVIDTGVAYEDYVGDQTYLQAEDLSDTVFTAGYDFVNDDAHANDDNGHGSHVTGTIAQSTDNAVGISGIAYNSTIMPIKALDWTGTGTSVMIANAIDFARENGAEIINMSLGSSMQDDAIRTATAAAVAADIVVVAATGNDGTSSISYPAGYDGVIAVGATDFQANLTGYSNFGPGIDIVAPGGDTSVDLNSDTWVDGILQETIEQSFIPDPTSFAYYFFQGTSMASPHVAGVAALLMAYGVDAPTVDDVLYAGARDLGAAGYDQTFGYGLVDAENSLDYIADNAPAGPGAIVVYTDTSKATQMFGTTHTEKTPYFEWQAPSETVAGYYVYFGTDATVDPATVGSLQTGLGYISPEISGNGVNYYLRVKSAGTNSINSTDVGVYTYVIDTTAAAPSTVSAGRSAAGNVISWSAATDEGHQNVTYEVHRSRTENGSYSKVGTGSSTTRSYTDDAAKVGRQFYYKIKTIDDLQNQSDFSSAVSVIRAGNSEIIAGRGNGGSPQVKVFDSIGTLKSSFYAYSSQVKSGVNLASGDLDGDGEEEIITGTGPGAGPQVRVFDKNGNVKMTAGFFAYGENVRTGVKVAAGDVDGDGLDEIITGTGNGAGPQVRYFDGKGNVKGSFFAYDSKFRGGVEVGAADYYADGTDSIITAPGPGGGPQVKIFNKDGTMKKSFFAYAQTLKTGIFVGGGDVTGDGINEIITGTGNGAGPQVRVFDRDGNEEGTTGFFPYSKNFRGGVFTQPGDLNADGVDEIVTGTGVGGGPQVRVFNYKGDVATTAGFFAFEESFRGGVNVTVGDVFQK